ncbi:hypothetical protein FJ425_25545 [Mesorhizobium sp. B2-7-2]|nr:hypothetical protein FJ425_25545 [Mesorhizobium sp. B2-7-2]
MSPRSAQRFWDNDMHQQKDLKRVAWIRSARRALRAVSFRERRFQCHTNSPDPMISGTDRRRCKALEVLHCSADEIALPFEVPDVRRLPGVGWDFLPAPIVEPSRPGAEIASRLAARTEGK